MTTRGHVHVTHDLNTERDAVKIIVHVTLQQKDQIVERRRRRRFDGGDVAIQVENQVKTVGWSFHGCRPPVTDVVYLKNPWGGHWYSARGELNWPGFHIYNDAQHLHRRPSVARIESWQRNLKI